MPCFIGVSQKLAIRFIPIWNGERKGLLALDSSMAVQETELTGGRRLITVIEFPLCSNQLIIVIIGEDGSVHDRYLTVHNLLALHIARNISPLMPRSVMRATEHELSCY